MFITGMRIHLIDEYMTEVKHVSFTSSLCEEHFWCSRHFSRFSVTLYTWSFLHGNK